MFVLTNVKTNNKSCLLCICYIICASQAENGVAFNCQGLKELTVNAENGNGIEITIFHRNACKEADGWIIGEMIGLENGEKGFASLNITGGASPNNEPVSVIGVTRLANFAFEANDLTIFKIE